MCHRNGMDVIKSAKYKKIRKDKREKMSVAFIRIVRVREAGSRRIVAVIWTRGGEDNGESQRAKGNYRLVNTLLRSPSTLGTLS